MLYKQSNRKIFAGILAFNMLFWNIPLAAFATDITGVQGNNGVYNIEGQKFSGTTQFRQYNNFDLSQGDVANLIYKNGYNKFINLVNSQININGLVNTVNSSGAFYNGHAIFVSPLGMVVGSSGVLNVGSLSVLTPSQSKYNAFLNKYNAGNLSGYEHNANDYKGLITDSHGNIVINGKILARNEVNLYGDNITVQGTSDNKAGIIAGWNPTDAQNSDLILNKNYTEVFNNLVSNNITDTKNFALENGKIKIVAGFKDYKDDKPEGSANSAVVNIENAQLGANEVEIKANTTRDAYTLADSDEAISSKIDIKNSDITGSNIDILANSEDTYSRNVNLTVPTVFLWAFDKNTSSSGFFSEEVYDGFEGVRTSAVVNVIHSNLTSTGDLSIKTNASSETKISSDYISKFVPAILYGYGTKTESKINITENSNLKASNDVILNAISKNILNANVSNDTPFGVNIKLVDFVDAGFMKNSAVADTKITIDNSKINAKGDVSAQALAYNEMDNRLILKTRIGQNDFASQNVGGSSVSMGAILNATDIKSSIEIKNKSEIKADKDVTLNAYNINDVNNWVDSEVKDNTNYTAEWQDGNGYLSKLAEGLDKFDKIYDQLTSITIKDIYGKFSQKARNVSGLWDPQNNHNVLETAKFEAGFGGVWNNVSTTNNVTINNSTIDAKNINIKAHTVDMTYNEADAYAEEAAKWGGALSLVVNKQKNNNKVDILNTSKLNADNDIKVDSIVELPAQQGTFGISNMWFTLSVNFNFGADDNWDWDFHKPTASNVSSKIVPQGGIFGFYNNFAVSAGGGGDEGKAGVSAAIIYSELNNNSDINVINSTVGKIVKENDLITSATDNVIMNSVVSSSVHDAVDFITYDKITTELKDLIKKEFNKWNAQSDIAAGGAVLIQDFTNNAKITVDNSTINAIEGNAEFNSAAEQGYLSLVTPGGKAETIGVTGAVNVQNIHGTTSSTVKNNSKINANNITIDSGKANVQFTKKGADLAATGVEFLDDDDNVQLADKRDVEDHVTAIALNGSVTKQEGSGGGGASSGAAIGATVIAQSIDTIVKSQVVNSTLSAAGNIDVKAESKIKDVFLTIAGASAGGVSTNPQQQHNANQNPPNENQAGQQMQNVGNWIDIMDNANPDDEDVMGLNNLFNQNNPNQQGVNHAQGQAGDANQMAGGVANPQGAASNFSLALAGSVNVVNNNSIVEAEIVNSTINVGDELNVLANRDNFQLNITGGIAKSGSVGGGAAVNVYSDKAREITLKDADGNTIKDENGKDKTQTVASGAKAVIDSSHINFISDSSTKKVNVSATNNHKIINPAVGVGVAANKQSGVKAAVGGSFNANTLKDTTEAKITSTEIKNDFKKDAEGKPTDVAYSNNINVETAANAETTIWNVGGDLGFASGNNSSFSLGASVAGNLDILKQTLNSEISNSTLNNVKDVTVNSALKQDINSIGVAGAVVTGSQASFTIDGALGLEFIENNVTALLKNSTITSSGDIKTNAKSEILGSTSTGSLDINTAQSNVGVGIGAIINIDSSKVIAKNENVKIKDSKSVEVKADSKDNRKFVAANLGVSSGNNISAGITANGIIDIVKTTVNALIEGNNEIVSDGNIDVKSIYDNESFEITALLEGSSRISVGANIIANHFENDVKSQISTGTIISDAVDINVGAKTNSYLNMIPAAIAISKTGGGEGLIAAAVAADIAVNIIKDKTNAIAAGDITTKGNLTVAADNETTIYNRGGVLSAASSTAPVSIAGAINVDYIEKTTNAQIGDKNKKSTVNADGDVSVTSVSTNSIGGTPTKIDGGDEGEYKRDDITSKDYQDTLIKKDDAGKYSGLKYDSNFENWNMFYNAAAGGMGAISGTVIVKTIENTVNAEILNTNITKSSNLKVLASDYSIKNIIAGQVAAAKTAAVGVQVVVTSDKSSTSALISNNSDITTTNKARVIAKNQKDNKQIDVTAEGSKTASAGVNVLINTINDLTTAKIEDSKLSAGSLDIDAREDINALRVVVAAAGSANVAVNVSPVINYYGDDSKKKDNESDADYEKRTKGKTIAEISNSTINNAQINMSADTNVKTLDIGVGAAGAGTGFAASGLVIKNSNYTKTRALIDNNSKINTEKDITINANSTLDSNNWTVGASGLGIGFSAVVNVIMNDINSEVISKISDSTVDNAGNISLNTNKDKTDKLRNHGIAACGTGIGGAAVVTVIYNTYDNTVKSEIINATVPNAGSIAVNSYSDRDILNFDVSVGGAGKGVGAAVAAVVNNINTNTFAIIDAKDKNMKTTGLLSAVVNDNTYADNTIGFGAGGAGSAGANVNLYYSESLAKAQITSTTGQIEANSAEVKSSTTNGMKEKRIGIAAGGAQISGDVQVIRLGKATEYTNSDKNSHIDKAEQKVADLYNSVLEEGDKKFVPGVPSDKTVTGTVASVNGNLKTTNDIDIKAESVLKGAKDADDPSTLLMTNNSVDVGGGSASVGVKNVKINNNTIAEISGGQVESTAGKISVNAKNTAKVKIDAGEVGVAAFSLTGGSEVYNNTSNTIAQIVNAKVNSQTGIDVISNSVSDCIIDATHVMVKAAEVGVDLSETIDTNKSIAMISGKTDIDTKGKLNLQSIVDTDMHSERVTRKIEAVEVVNVFKNEVTVNSVSKAIMENVEGTIKANGIDMATQYSKMSAYQRTSATEITGITLASHETSKAEMNAEFTSGIYNAQKQGDKVTYVTADNLTIVNSGETKIETAKYIGTSTTEDKYGVNPSKIGVFSRAKNVDVTIGANFFAGLFLDAKNTTKSNTLLKVKDHSAQSLTIDSKLDTISKATPSATSATIVLGVRSVGATSKNLSTLNIDIAGKNTIGNTTDVGDTVGKAIINATNIAKSDVDLYSFDFAGVVGGQRVRLETEVASDTIGNIGGEFNAKDTQIAFNTSRESLLEKTSGSGGIILNVSDTKASNTLKGSSILNISGYSSSDDELNNKIAIKNTSTNTYKVGCGDGSGSIINISKQNDTTELNSSTTTNIINSAINSKDDVNFEVTNNTVLDDSGTMGGGGVISVLYSNNERKYTSAANLNFENTEINANNIVLRTLSNIHSKVDSMRYRAVSGGVVAIDTINAKNTLVQTSAINLKNSKLYSKNDTWIHPLTTSRFKQDANSDARGLGAGANADLTLDVKNTNQVNIDSNSVISALHNAVFYFDSNNNLMSSVVPEAYGFGARPSGVSVLKLAVNNELKNEGLINSGEQVVISYMPGSVNELTNWVHTKSVSFIAGTSEEGKLERTINNKLIVPQGAKITSDNSISVSYLSGTDNIDSKVKWETDSLWGLIHDEETTYPKSLVENYSLSLDGEMIAGKGSDKYLKIKQDGSIDEKESYGFSANEYSLKGGDISDGQTVKDQKLSSITVKINNAEFDLNNTELQKKALENEKSPYDTDLIQAQNQIDDFNYLVNKGYTLKNSKVEGDNTFSDFNAVIQNDLKSQIVGNTADKITLDKYNSFVSAYKNKLTEISEYNKNHPDDIKTIPSLSEFLASDSSLGFSQTQKNTINTTYNSLQNSVTGSKSGSFTVYTSLDGTKYVSVENPREISGKITCNEIEAAKAQITTLNEKIQGFDSQIATLNDKITDLTNNIIALKNEKITVNNTHASEFVNSGDKYSVEFSNLQASKGVINISGIKNGSQFKGNGTLKVANGGIKVDNYSTRSLIFGDINMSSGGQGGLIIDGKNFAEFANKEQAVNGRYALEHVFNITPIKILDIELPGLYNAVNPADYPFEKVETAGAHYITGSGNGTQSITINNFYDTANPFAKNQNILNPTSPSDIIFNGLIATNKDFNVFNDSGSIIANKINPDDIGTLNLVATKGDINLTSSGAFVLGSQDSIFAGNSVNIKANSADIKGKITAGYNKDLTLTITDDMLKNLSYDPTTNEDGILINLGDTPWVSGTNNVKALYKDNQIHLFNINDPVAGTDKANRGKVSIVADTVSNTGTINMYDNYQNINIDNKTDKQLNVYNISNTKSQGGLFKGDILQTAAEHIANASTKVTSNGKLVLDGVIKNNLMSDAAATFDVTSKGVLDIISNNGLEIKKQTDINDNITNSISASGNVNIKNNAQDTLIDAKISDTNGDITISNDGTNSVVIAGLIQNEKGNILFDNSNAGDVEISSDVFAKNGSVTMNNIDNLGDLKIFGNVTVDKGNIDINQDLAGDLIINSEILKKDDATEGDINISNKNSGDVRINKSASIQNNNGDISIHSDGTSDIFQAGTLIVSGENNDVTITNTEGAIYSFAGITSAEGDINILNTTGDLIIGAGDDDITIYSTAKGDIFIANVSGDFILNKNAYITNLSVPEEGKTYYISLYNYDTASGMFLNGYIYNTGGGDITIVNRGQLGATIAGTIENEIGDIIIENDTKALYMEGEVTAYKGNIDIINNGDDVLNFDTDARITSEVGDIEIKNRNSGDNIIKGIITAKKGNILLENENSNILIGEYESTNNNYINANNGNVTIKQTNGNILNNVVDTTGGTHQNYNLANSEQSYKTLIKTSNDLILNVADGSIGSTTSSNPGFSIEAATRDWTESINVDVSGSITAKAINNNDSDSKLVNLRTVGSDMNIKEIESSGNVILTAADWKQADIKPTPDDEDYFKGYSILNASGDNNPVIKGQNISLIASDKIGDETKQITFEQDTLNAPKSSVSMEAENDLYISGKSNSNNDMKIYQMLSKHGDINFGMQSNADIAEITAGGGLKLTQKAQNLTIRSLGVFSAGLGFNDILYPHDDLPLSGGVITPKYAIIKVLDAANTPERSDSNLKIYSAYVTGNNGDNAQYYPDGTRLADYTLMADNIYANSDKAPSSNISTKSYPNGYKQTETTWTNAEFGGAGTIVHKAEGLNVLGDGGEISLDIMGVDEDEVNALIPNAQRDNYLTQNHNPKTPSKFQNNYDRLTFYDYDFKANDVVASINDYANPNRNVSIDTLYANNAYINTPAANFKIEDGIITNYAELRNEDKLAIVDNDFRRLIKPADIQLYTQKTGSFNLALDRTINMRTTAPTVYNNPHMLVNGYHSEWNFVNLGQKEAKDRHDRLDTLSLINKNYNESQKRISLRFDTTHDNSLLSNYEIYDISTTGALIKNNGHLKKGKTTIINIKFDDIDIDVKAKVVNINGDIADVEFKNLPKDVANLILYRYMQKKGSMKITSKQQ